MLMKNDGDQSMSKVVAGEDGETEVEEEDLNGED